MTKTAEVSGDIAALQTTTKKAPRDPAAWLAFARGLATAGRHEEAAAAFLRAETFGAAPHLIRFQLTCTYAQAGDAERALQWLQRAIDAGFDSAWHLQTDPRLESLRGDGRFAGAAAAVLAPVAFYGEYHELDFWLGSWSVLAPDGSSVGENLIARVVGGAAMVERWRDKEGGEGMSLFYFDLPRRLWKQVWVTDQATHKEKQLVGKTPEGGLIFQGTIRRRHGGEHLDRTILTPLPNGDVHQLIETSTDSGGRWQAGFDGLYVRRDRSAW